MISPRILFVHNYPTRFVTLDLALLRERYQVTELFLERRLLNPLSILAQVQRHDLVFAWFASWHSFFPLLFANVLRKPSLLVIGGYDLANMPEIGYGHQRGGLKKWVACLTMRLATCLMTNSYYSQKEAERNAGVPKQRIQVVYHGVPDPLGELPLGSRAPMALTVGNLDRSNLRRKGHELFVLAARLVPDVEFVLAGAWKDDAVEYLRTISSPNVAFTGWVDDKTLLDYYRSASVYVQASAHEGFGLAVAEAMLADASPWLRGLERCQRLLVMQESMSLRMHPKPLPRASKLPYVWVLIARCEPGPEKESCANFPWRSGGRGYLT
jgi:glycosyltransferase involved in cell wall biosynthesis